MRFEKKHLPDHERRTLLSRPSWQGSLTADRCFFRNTAGYTCISRRDVKNATG